MWEKGTVVCKMLDYILLWKGLFLYHTLWELMIFFIVVYLEAQI